jgi:hypothetical protein
LSKRLVLALALAGFLAACEDPRRKQIEKIREDEETIKQASAVVNEVIRNSLDCEAAKPLIPEAYKRIEEAHRTAQAPAAHATLDALKVQVDRVKDACP